MWDDSEPGSTEVAATRSDTLSPGDADASDPVRSAEENSPTAAAHPPTRTRLAEVHDEAQSLIRDATHQAMLVAVAAEQAAEDILAQARAEAEQERAQARAEAEQERAQAKLAAADLGAQAEQILLEAQREADQRHASLSAELARSWRDHERELHELLALAQTEAAAVRMTAAQQADGVLEQARNRAAQLLSAAETRLDQAHAEAAAVLAQAREQADAVLAEAARSAADHHDRAERRLAEAEAGARAVREQVAEQVGSSQREMYELRRAAKAEASLMVSDALAQVDEARALAHHLLAEARAEGAALTGRRDAVAAELEELSGNLAALAAPAGGDRPPHPLEAHRYQPVGIHLAHETGEPDDEDIDGGFPLDQLMRAATDSDQHRALPVGHAWLRSRRGRSAAG